MLLQHSPSYCLYSREMYELLIGDFLIPRSRKQILLGGTRSGRTLVDASVSQEHTRAIGSEAGVVRAGGGQKM